MPLTRLFLLRHGQTAANVSRVLQGPGGADEPLDPVGETQAQAVAAHLATLGLPAPCVYASTYRRAWQTARVVADALGASVTVLGGIHEIDPGDWVGRPYGHLRTHASELRGPGGALAFPGGESLGEVGERFLRALISLPPGETPVVVSHGGALSAVLAALLGEDATETWLEGRYAHAGAALTELERTGDTWRALRLADARHLP